MSNRYDRQTVLPEMGAQGQSKISAASVLCTGAGGLGCPALLYLAAAGVGRIGIVDFDVVDESNLQRQVLFTTAQLGDNKAEAAKERLLALNPTLDIQAHAEELTDKNAEALFAGYDIIIDGTDNFATKFLINDAAVKTGKPFIYGSILGFEGQVAVFNYKDGPCYRCLFPEAPKGHIPNCAEAGVIGAVAGLIGTTQAMEAIKIIVEHESFQPLTGKLWTVDVRSMENRILSLPRDKQCPVCSKEPNDIDLEYTSPVCDAVSEIPPEQALKHEKATLIDVREIEEWNAGHIDEAHHAPLSALMTGADIDFPSSDALIVYCKSGVRSKQAAEILKTRGYTNIQSLAGGYDAWLKSA